MRDRLDRHQERLSPEDRRRLWERLRPSAARAQREITVRRWSVSFGLAVVVVVIAAAMITERKQERARRDRGRPVDIVPYGSATIPSGPASAGQIDVRPRPTGGGAPYRVPGIAPPFTETKRDSLSTFAFDVEGTGYTAARRYLERGTWPPPDVVRVEDFVNTFRQGCPEVAAADFGIFLDGAPSPFGEGCQLVRVVLKARGGAADSGIVVARDAHVLVRFDARSVVSHRLIGFDARGTPSGGSRDGRSITAGHEVTALYEVRLSKRRAPGRILSVRIDYVPPEAGAPRSVTAQIASADLHPLFATAPARLRLAAAVAEFAEILSRYPWTANHRIADVLPMVRQLAQELHADPEVVELANLVERTASLEAAGAGGPSR
jgi:chorismate mutase